MMKYIPCPHCGSQNRETDTKCYMCEKPMSGAPAAGEGVLPDGDSAIPPRSETHIPKSSFFKMPAQNRDTTWIDGLRSGALSGVALGTVCGLTCSLFYGMIISAFLPESSLGNQAAVAGLAGIIFFFIIFFSNVVYGALIGALLGGINVLCYQLDCAKIGGIIGLVLAVVFALIGHSFNLTGIFSGAVHGAMIGVLASYIEKKVFRKQYAEL
ncbi:MAG: hypothetical protein AB2L14_05110 [Candidatus Xenobiia bacterium LiM19]